MPRVDAQDRDRSIVEHIQGYCEDIAATHAEFEHSREKFCASRTYQNAIGMCVLQIGELVRHFSAEFVEAHPQID